MPSSCKDIRAALASCLLESECVLVNRNTPTDCLQEPLVNDLPTRCKQLKRGYGDCKRGMIDMRKRFRGNQPMAVSQEFEREKVPQLYGGAKAVGDAGVSGTGKAANEADLVEGMDGEFRAKR